MKPIKLTNKHKIELLKMLRILYPRLQHTCMEKGLEYYDYASRSEVEDLCGFNISGGGQIMCSFPYDQQDDSFHIHLIKSIHWYEFCCTHLIEELATCQFNGIVDDVIFEQTKMDYFKAIGLNGEHPVDYLYKLYKSIPKGQ